MGSEVFEVGDDLQRSSLPSFVANHTRHSTTNASHDEEVPSKENGKVQNLEMGWVK